MRLSDRDLNTVRSLLERAKGSDNFHIAATAAEKTRWQPADSTGSFLPPWATIVWTLPKIENHSPAHAGSEVIGGAVAESLGAECLSLPCSVDLSDAQAARVVALIQAVRP